MDAAGRAIAEVAARLEGARDPWWIIGSTAVWLHGVETTVADVDVLTSVSDAEALFGLRVGAEPARDTLFRSRRYGRFATDGLPVEVMAGLMVMSGGRWHEVLPLTRRAIAVGPVCVHVPERAELIRILRLFGRDKDVVRADLLAADPH